MDITETTFVETSRQTYPYRMVHAAECASAKRSKWGTVRTFDQVAENKASTYSREEWHEGCIKTHGDLWSALLKRAGTIERDRKATKKRHDAMVDYSIALVASQLLVGDIGEMTPEELGFHRARVEQLYSGQFRPTHSRDFASYVVSKAPSIDEAYPQK